MSELTVHVGDIANGCQEVPTSSIDLSITSPPYFAKDGYSDALMRSLGRVLGRTLKQGARAYIVFGQIKEKLDRPLDAQRAILLGGGGKLEAGQTIIWVKSIAVGGWDETCPAPSCGQTFKLETLSRGHFQPINSPNLMNYCWEYVFCFVKKPLDKALPLARTAVGVPFTDKSNMTRGTRGKNGDLHCPGDIWFLPYETTSTTIKKVHRHEFPAELARRLIKVSGIAAGSLVYDPFIGGGTTAFAARELGMDAVGHDKNEIVVDTLKKSWLAPV